MQEKFRFEDGPDDATRTLASAGDLDSAAAGNLSGRVEQALAAGKRRVIVDLTEVTFIETGALNQLLDANARVARFGAQMPIVIPRDSQIRRVFSITRLDRVLKVVESRQEALLAS